MIGALGFVSPWLLAALAVLPVIWWLLRAIPPAPIRRVFPAVSLLLGLEAKQVEAQRSPWWLLMLRMIALAALIIGFAGPLLGPKEKVRDAGPLVVLIDNFWPATSDWPIRIEALDQLLASAQQKGRPVTLALAHAPEIAPFSDAGAWRGRLAAMRPVAWDATYDTEILTRLPKGEFLWVSDGLAREGRAEILAARNSMGPITVWQPDRAIFGLGPATLEGAEVRLRVVRSKIGSPAIRTIRGMGRDPAGQLRALVTDDVEFAIGTGVTEALFSPPPELRHRIEWFEIADENASGAVSLVGEALTRRRVALIGALESETLALLSPDHFLRAALEGQVEIVEALHIEGALRASPHVVILPDVPEIAEPDQRALAKWVAEGGLLLRFAGPRLAASQRGRARTEDVLLPVRLRGLGRVVGGAMSWGTPQSLAEFTPDSPFFGLNIPKDVTVSRQVLAEPGPELSNYTLAQLSDGTPLVTRKLLGAGQVVLVHVGANAEWSSLVLSGLFVDMLKRLTDAASGRSVGVADDETLVAGGTMLWRLQRLLSAEGQLVRSEDADAGLSAVSDKALRAALTTRGNATVPPGVYDANARQAVVSVLAAEAELKPAKWPPNIVPTWGGSLNVKDLSGIVLSVGLILLLVDILATLWITGRLFGTQRAKGTARAAVAIVALGLAAPDAGRAQASTDTDMLHEQIAAASNVTFGHVLTGDTQLDALAQAGLIGLSDALFARTSVEPAPPVGVDLERDELSVFPVLYWPVSPVQTLPSAAAYERLARYLASGGFILFDTRDAGAGGRGAEAQKLQTLATPLALPPLEPVPGDHVVTRAFYLLDAFPGRFTGPIWAEAAPDGAVAQEGMPFRVLNDGVTPVIIGGNDWAGAWAVDENGLPLRPVGRGRAGERQREMAFRFGINLVMHVLTGNYKSDQVHVPALLERLGQ